jgi:hypothetical protein
MVHVARRMRSHGGWTEKAKRDRDSSGTATGDRDRRQRQVQQQGTIKHFFVFLLQAAIYIVFFIYPGVLFCFMFLLSPVNGK